MMQSGARGRGGLCCCVLMLVLAAAPARAELGDNSVGMNIHVGYPAHIDAAADLGVSWVRMDANWHQIETADDVHNWAALDAWVNTAHAAGLKVFLTLAYTPAWVPREPMAREDDFPGNDTVAGSSEWVDFVKDAVSRYCAQGVTHFGLWNEPNLEQFWDGSLEQYVDRILVPGAAAVREACAACGGTCKVLGPDLANVGDCDAYLENVLSRAGAEIFDIIAHHTYNDFAETGWHFWDGDGFINVLDDQRLPGFTRKDLRQILDAAGYQGEVWITETGYKATPIGDTTEEDLQAVYVRRVLEEQLGRAWYTNSFFYEISDAQPELQAGGGPASACGDGLDNDGDGLVDLDDPGCESGTDDDESDDPASARIPVYRGVSLSLDGDLDDFGPDGWQQLSIANWRGDEALGAGDLSVRAAARWSALGLWIAVEVEDDIHDNEHAPADLWLGDSLQLGFDMGLNGGAAYDEVDDHEINFALAAGQIRTHRFWGPADADDSYQAAIVREANTSRYEILLPPGALPGLGLSPGQVFGFSFLVNEADGDGRVGWMEWTPGIGSRKMPGLFGELELLDETGEISPSDGGISDGGELFDASSDPDGGQAEDGSSTSDAGGDTDDRPDAGQADDDVAQEEGGGCGCGSSAQTGWSQLWLMFLGLGVLRKRRS